MTTLEIKNNFHQLIDSIENENLLRKFYELMLRKRALKDGILWNKLSDEERDELLLANKESENPDHHISHDEIRKKYAEWL